jgi:hypothetical protein
MPTEPSASIGLRAAIIAQSKIFLTGLKAGLSDDQLNSILSDIKEKELQLIKQEGSMLDPEMWKLLQNRIAKRKTTNIIEPSD